jgi:hypothetical protein
MTIRVLLALLALVFCFQAKAETSAQDTSPFEFVSEYVQEIGRLTQIQEQFAQPGDNPDALVDVVSRSTTMQLELGSDIARMEPMHLNVGQGFDLSPAVITLYEAKREAYSQIAAVSKEALSDPSNFGKWQGEVAEQTAKSVDIDHKLLLICASVTHGLVDFKRPDPQGHIKRLVLTASQRQELIQTATDAFGPAPQSEDVRAALRVCGGILKNWLSKEGYLSADDPRQ